MRGSRRGVWGQVRDYQSHVLYIYDIPRADADVMLRFSMATVPPNQTPSSVVPRAPRSLMMTPVKMMLQGERTAQK